MSKNAKKAAQAKNTSNRTDTQKYGGKKKTTRAPAAPANNRGRPRI